MAIPAFLLPLLGQGLSLLTNAAVVKGQDWLEEKTGVDLSQAHLSADEIVKLKNFEREYEKELLDVILQDRANARKMQEVALQQDDLFSKRFVYYLASFWSIVATLYIACITFMTIPVDNIRFADTVLGFVLGTVIATVIGFFFGSSEGSKDKSAFLKEVSGRVSK
jgi:Fe2+ transport system protein B